MNHILEAIRIAREPSRALCWLASIVVVAATGLTATAAVVPSEARYVKSLNRTWRFKLEQPVHQALTSF